MFDLMLATDRSSGSLPPETREEISHLVDLNAGLFKGGRLSTWATKATSIRQSQLS